MAAAALLALLPGRWTRCADGLGQPVSPLTWILSSGTRHARETLKSVGQPTPTREGFEQLRRQNRRLAQQVGQQQLLIGEMERQVAELSGLRDQLADSRARIIFASVVGGDTSPQRETITISKGRRHGVEQGDWVAAGAPPAERDPAATGRDLLLRQWLIGRVDEVQPYLSRVQLTTDPHFGPQRVWTARALADGTWQLADQQCGLTGSGSGIMRIDRASKDYRAADYTIVLLPLAYPQPMAMAIGRVVGSQTLETGLHYELEVEPWDDPYTLSYVYVISLSQQAGP